MFDQKKIAEDYTFFANLFNVTEKDQDEELYKKQLYVLKDEIDDKINQNSLKFKHDVLLSKLMLEDYNEFPPKNTASSQQKNQNDKDGGSKEEEGEKLAEQENEFLRELHRINYLTFSPFALSFFDKFGENTENGSSNTARNTETERENEEKMLKMLNFKYDSFDINNDLLFNICQGFIDMNKLKEENLSSNQQPVLVTEGVKSTMPTEPNAPKEESDDEEVDNESVNFVMNWITVRMKNNAKNSIVDTFLTELEGLPKNAKKREKNTFFAEWKAKIIALERAKQMEEEEYKKKLIEKQERENKLIEEQKQKEIEKQIKLQDEKEFEELHKKMKIQLQNKKNKNVNNKKSQKTQKKPAKPAKKPIINFEQKDKRGERDTWLNKKSYNLLDNY